MGAAAFDVNATVIMDETRDRGRVAFNIVEELGFVGFHLVLRSI